MIDRRPRHRGRPWIALLAALLPMAAGAVPPPITADAALIMDPDNGQILFAKDPNRRLPPASTTKVLTALLALERMAPNDLVTVSPAAADTPASRLGLRPGEAVTTLDLLYAIMLRSANDAAEVLAEAMGGSLAGFADIMNARARALGALDSHFANPHGLPDERHYSTAYDLALLFRYAMENRQFAEIVRTRNATLWVVDAGAPADPRLVPVANTNRMLVSFQGALGGKTGYTRAAGRCFVGEARRGRRRVLVSMLGSSRMWEDLESLFEFGFQLASRPPSPVRDPILSRPAERMPALPVSAGGPRPALPSVLRRLTGNDAG